MEQLPKSWKQVQTAIEMCLLPHGFDLVKAFPIARYNENVSIAYALPTFEEERRKRAMTHATLMTSDMGLLIANTHKLWPAFIRHLRHRLDAAMSQEGILPHPATEPTHDESAHRREILRTLLRTPTSHRPPTVMQGPEDDVQVEGIEEDHLGPLDHYTYTTLRDALRHVTTRAMGSAGANEGPRIHGVKVRFSFHPPPYRIAMQRCAHVAAGMAYHHDTSHLSVHPVYGPWLGLRAVAVCEVAGGAETMLQAAPCGTSLAADTTTGEAWTWALRNPMVAKQGVTMGAIEKDLKDRLETAIHTPAATKSSDVAIGDGCDWRSRCMSDPRTNAWIALRDALADTVPEAHLYRYGDAQMYYHYTHDLGILEEEVLRCSRNVNV